jgi:hypothetical protein
MTRLRRRCAAVSVGAVAALTVVAAPSAHALTLAVRYASPTGSGSACSAAAPCRIGIAVNNAPAGSEVVLTPGAYGSADNPLKVTLGDLTGTTLHVHGAADAPPPVLYLGSTNNGITLSGGSTLSDIALISSNDQNALLVSDGDVDHVVVISSTAATSTCGVYGGTFSDSLCVNSTADSSAVGIIAGADNQTTIRNVTGIETGSGGGLLSSEGGSGTNTVLAKNSIFSGAGPDIATQTLSTGPATITIDHSDYSSTTNGTHGTITPGAGNIDDDPVFVDPATNNYQEKAGSPTVNAGSSAPAGDTDLAGNPRTLGSAVDMGAYERLQKPGLKKLTVGKVTKHSVHLSVKVNPQGLAATVRAVIRKPGPNLTSKLVSAGHGRSYVRVDLVVRGLKRHTTYHAVAIARNSAGDKTSAAKKLHTH